MKPFQIRRQDTKETFIVLDRIDNNYLLASYKTDQFEFVAADVLVKEYVLTDDEIGDAGIDFG